MRLRFVTWNVRHGLGLDRQVSLERVLRVLTPLEPDVVALQELDVRRARSRHVDQPAWLADRLAMRVVFAQTCAGYGHALFCRGRISRHREVPLPHGRASEPRAVIDATLDTGVRVLATHLGLIPHERAAQARVVMDALGEARMPLLLLGDLNASPGAGRLRRARPRAEGWARYDPLRARCTWPALWPFRALDHALASEGVVISDGHALGEGAARLASDHRPIVGEAAVAR
ncbi:MAG: endonuclease/exonuclease/phosphatase family protein [Sandaracinaceae bacterium]|nr:endonuclease/exonuclease/phosphatase family protein [Sandaracinaceae bacterium]